MDARARVINRMRASMESLLRNINNTKALIIRRNVVWARRAKEEEESETERKKKEKWHVLCQF